MPTARPKATPKRTLTTVPWTVYLEPAVLEVIKARAQQERRSVANLLKVMLEDDLERWAAIQRPPVELPPRRY